MKVTLHMSMSVNAVIAREDDRCDFLAPENWQMLVELAHEAGAVVWGRRTHEVVRGYGGSFLTDLDGLTRIVLTSAADPQLEAGWEVARTPHEALARVAKAGGSHLLVVGGASVNSAFASAGLIDDVILNVESVIIGNGRPLFAPAEFDIPLLLAGMERVRDEIIQLHYKVKK